MADESSDIMTCLGISGDEVLLLKCSRTIKRTNVGLVTNMMQSARSSSHLTQS
jgi:hypothetical protein